MKKNLNKLATLALTGILMTGMSFGALAATPDTDGTVLNVGANDKKLELKKELAVLDVDDLSYTPSSPAVKYSYEFIDLENAELGTIPEQTTPRKNGKTDAGVPSVGDVTFGTNDKVADCKVTKNIKIDFSDVEWKEAGVYRYKLHEKDVEKHLADGYDYGTSVTQAEDGARDRYIDVYVEWEDDSLVIEGYAVSYVESGKGKVPGYEVAVDGATVTYGDGYATYDLTVSKVVTGALGDKSKNFNFTAKVTVPVNAVYGYKRNNTVETNIETSGEINETLAHGDSFTIQGVPTKEKVAVKEDDYTTGERYKTTVKKDGGDVTYTAGVAAEFGDNEKSGKATAVEFTNSKEGTTPTGVVMNIAPYAAMILGAGAFAGVFLGRKKSEDKE